MFCLIKYLIFKLKLKVEIVERNDKMTRYLKSKAQLYFFRTMSESAKVSTSPLLLFNRIFTLLYCSFGDTEL